MLGLRQGVAERDQLVTGPGQQPGHRLAPGAAPHCLGISFDGSNAGFGDTTAFTRPEVGWSTSNSVPSASYSIGSMAYPMFLSRRGEWQDEVTRSEARR